MSIFFIPGKLKVVAKNSLHIGFFLLQLSLNSSLDLQYLDIWSRIFAYLNIFGQPKREDWVMFQTFWKERQIDQLHKHTYLCVWLIIFDQLMRGEMALVYQRKCSSKICSLSILHWPPNFSTKDFHMISHRFTHAAINSVLHWLVVYQEFLNATIVSQTGCLIFLGFLHFLGSKRVPWGDTLQMLLFANGKYKLKFKQIYFEIRTNIMCTLNKYERVPWGRCAAYANASVRQWPSRQHFPRLHQIPPQMAASME